MDQIVSTFNMELNSHKVAGNDNHSATNSTNNVLLKKKLRIFSFNSTGFGHSNQAKVQSMCDNFDIMIIQEH